MFFRCRSRAIRPGDVFRVGTHFPSCRLDPDEIDYLTIHYETRAPGLAHVVQVNPDKIVFDLWGHRFETTQPPGSLNLHPLGRLARIFAPERLGEAILRREIGNSAVVIRDWPKPQTQPLIGWWLRQTRGCLPILHLFGGRIHPPFLRLVGSYSRYWLKRWRCFPQWGGYLDHGLLIDRIGVTVSFTYARQQRKFWLDRILLHKNHSIHLVGVELTVGEQRTFRLDKVQNLVIPGLGAVEREHLYWELAALHMSRSSWMWSWNRLQQARGLPLAPKVGPLGRLMGGLTVICRDALRALIRAPRTIHSRYSTLLALGAQIKKNPLLQWVRHWPRSRKARRRMALRRGMPAWRRRLLLAINVLAVGGYEQVTCLLPLRALVKSHPVLCRAFLRELLQITLNDANTDPAQSPLATALLARAAELESETGDKIRWHERIATANMLITEIDSLLAEAHRIRVETRKSFASDFRLLFCRACLLALYGASRSGNPPAYQAAWFYRASTYFVARSDRMRFRMDQTSIPKLELIVAWWDRHLPANNRQVSRLFFRRQVPK